MVSSMAVSLDKQAKIMSASFTASEMEVITFALPEGRDETSFSRRISGDLK